MPAQLRQKDKIVLLPRSASEKHEAEAAAAGSWGIDGQRQLSAEGTDFLEQQQPASSLFLDLTEVLPDSRGRVTVYCIAESLDRSTLETLAAGQMPDAVLTSHSEVLHLSLPVSQGSEPADCFFFDYGVVCCWGLTAKQEQDILSSLAKKAQQQPLPPREIEVDRFEYNYSTAAPPSMQNDTITISRHHSNDPAVKLAICHALAQSTKLCIHEERVLELVLETKHMPQSLAQHGTVTVTAEEVAQRIGQVFIQRAAVNLLGSVLDTPEFFWSAPDQLQTLYERACDYLELDRRVEVLNARFTVLQGMLDMMRDHITTSHSVRIEWIIIWLIAVELVVGCVELLGLFGLVGREGH